MHLVRRVSVGLSALSIAGVVALAGLVATGLLDTSDSGAAPPRSSTRPPAAAKQQQTLGALSALHARLAALDAAKPDTTPPLQVGILQIGDSHTAADHFTGRLRQLFQQRFGNAGRGFLPPGAPHAYYRPYGVAVTQSPGWRTLTSNKATPDAATFGLAGLVTRGSRPEDVITIEIKDATAAQAFEISIRRQVQGGALVITADAQTLTTLSTAGDDAGLSTLTLPLPSQTRRIELRPLGNGPVEIADHRLLGTGSGVSLSNLGFIGAQVSIMARWDWPTVRAQITRLDPALILVAFGTNEGFAATDRIAASYAATFEQRVLALKAAAPNASLVIVGPPDAGRYPRFCLPPPPPLAKTSKPTRESGPAALPAAAAEALRTGTIIAAWPPAEPPETAVCTPLSAPERQRYDLMLASKDPALCRWHTPAALPLAREAQRQVAARLGLPFFDWAALFDGECGADRWARKGLAHKDRVHFKQEGYARAADRLYELLLTGYPSKKQAP